MHGHAARHLQPGTLSRLSVADCAESHMQPKMYQGDQRLRMARDLHLTPNGHEWSTDAMHVQLGA